MGLKLFRDRPYVESMLPIMDGLLEPEGEALASFGPAWYYPLGRLLLKALVWRAIWRYADF